MIPKPLLHATLADSARLLGLVTLIAIFSCALFGLAASLAVAGLFYATGPSPDSAMIPGFLAKAAGFAVLAGAAFFGARRVVKATTTFLVPPDEPVLAGRTREWLALIPPLIVAAALVFPRLGAYPWAAPDEIHHLSVARNVATLGMYASGHPDGELVPFDTYDSVGPPVILPVALAFRLGGVNLGAGRAVMAIYFLALCIVLFALLKPAMGAGGAAIAVFFMTCSFGSVYLGRTLYGEVPGLMWMGLGLLGWRRAMKTRAGIGWGLAAGVAFGLAVLCKPILLLSAFAFLGALIYDRLTFRRIRLTHVIAPAAGVVVVMGAWWLVQTMSRHDVAGAAGGTLGIYKHNLMFGLRSAPHALARLFTDAGGQLAVVLLFAVFMVFWIGYDPALGVVWFLAVFYAWWWAFFTPGTMPRYLWFTAAIGGAFTAWFLIALKDIVAALLPRRETNARFLMAVMVVAVVLLLAATARDLTREAKGVYAADEMGDDYALSAWAAQLPAGTAVAATWPVSGTLNFLANKPARVLETIPVPIPANQVCIIDTMTRPDMLGNRQPDRRFGRYAVLTAKE
ncbi:MAG: glycosyltransferase family 39 protein [Candidatus Hydrogenedentes bacterium]|nr:glycosyltransferase family 39 protein [Candidatus Hydrogenedentota bacterium]